MSDQYSFFGGTVTEYSCIRQKIWIMKRRQIELKMVHTVYTWLSLVLR